MRAAAARIADRFFQDVTEQPGPASVSKCCSRQFRSLRAGHRNRGSLRPFRASGPGFNAQDGTDTIIAPPQFS